MTVGELKNLLSEYSDDTEVYIGYYASYRGSNFVYDIDTEYSHITSFSDDDRDPSEKVLLLLENGQIGTIGEEPDMEIQGAIYRVSNYDEWDEEDAVRVCEAANMMEAYECASDDEKFDIVYQAVDKLKDSY